MKGWQEASRDRPPIGVSYGSYRLAQVQDVAKVSFEMGNSPQVVHRHYKELVTEAQAKAWFDLRPAATDIVAPAFRA